MNPLLSDDPNLAPLSLVFDPSFWGLERRYRAHSSFPSQPLGHVYWIGLERGGWVQWTEAMSLRDACERAAAERGVQLPCAVSDPGLLTDLRLLVHHEAFQRIQPIPYPDGTTIEEMNRGGRRFSLWMRGHWWSDWKLYGNIPYDLSGLIRCGAAEIRVPHREEYDPWKRLDALLVPILGPARRHWYVRWGRPYRVHTCFYRGGEWFSLFLGDALDVVKMTKEQILARLPQELLDQVVYGGHYEEHKEKMHEYKATPLCKG